MHGPEIEKVLTNLGYELKRVKDGWQTNRIYAHGDNPTALTIYPEKNLVIDWVQNVKFSIPKLIALSIGTEDLKDVDEWLTKQDIKISFPEEKPKLNFPKTFPKEILNELLPIHDYWLKRGISLETLRLFKGGLAGNKGVLKNRYVFPIFDAQNNIVGFTGRDVLENGAKFKRPKWKHLNSKGLWKWPLFLNHQIIKDKKEAILVESVGCCLSLWEAGIKNSICLFGVELNNAILNFLLRFDISKIIIATNNDALNDGDAGNIAAQKIEKKLSKFFDQDHIIIHLPRPEKDFNEILMMEDGKKLIQEWYKGIK